MFLIRRTKPDDIDTLLKLAKTVHFINLPADKEIIAEKVRRARISFRAAANGEEIDLEAADGSAASRSPLFMFTIEDIETGNCLGTSMVVSKMGGPGYPNLSFTLRRKEMFSRDLQYGVIHVVARLTMDESGPSEIGGLILGPTFRRHPAKLGKQLSLIRFHYIGLHREYFADRILAEMMAPITSDGRNLFWDALGRLFINLSYEEADKFCQHSREFMTSLLPTEDIYLTLLPPEATKVVGQVGRDTEPARRMLENLGFKYTGRIDPFDGGPHLEAVTDEIQIIRDTRRTEFAGACRASEAKTEGFVSLEDEAGEFRAIHTTVAESADGSSIRLTKEVANLLEAAPGAVLGYTPIPIFRRPQRARSDSDSAKTQPKKTKTRKPKVKS